MDVAKPVSKEINGTRVKAVSCLAKALASIFSTLVVLSCGSSGPPYSPEKALETFVLPEGFRIELVAAEPEVVDPISMAFDERGNLYVVEMGDYPLSEEPLSRVKLLKDEDEDGRFELSTIFAEDLHFAHGVMPWKEGILVASAPDILYFEDTNGDGRADRREVVLTGFAEVNPQLRVNTPTYEMDNWIYAAYPKFGAGRRFPQFSTYGQPINYARHPEVPPVDAFSRGMDIRFKPDKLKLEAVSGNSEFGLAFNARGHRFPSWNDKHAQHVVIENRYLSRNPYLAADSAVALISDHGDSARIYPVSDNPALEEIRQTGALSQLGHFTSACGQSIYAGGSFPTEYDGAYFICEPVHNLVHADFLDSTGATYSAKRIDEDSEFLASKDSWFMPVFTSNGPDGSLYVVDFHRKIVEHPEWIREDYVDAQELFYQGNDRGRIYRVVYGDGPQARRPKLDQEDTTRLVQELANPNRWWRITAQRLLVARQDPSSIGPLKNLFKTASSSEARMHALWTLAGLDALEVELVLEALSDQSGAVREQAVRLAENHLADSSVAARLVEMTQDPDDRVAFQLACTLGELPSELSFTPLLRIAERHLESPWFVLAILTAASDTAAEWFRTVTRSSDWTRVRSEERDKFIQQISSIVGARQEEEEISLLLSSLLQSPDKEQSWQLATVKGLGEGIRRAPEDSVHFSSRTQNLLIELVDRSPSEWMGATLDLAGALELKDSAELRALIQKASREATDRNRGVEDRARSTLILGLDPTDSSVALLKNLLVPQEAEEVQRAAARAMINMPDTQAVAFLIEHWNSYTPSVREIVWRGLRAQSGRAALLLDAVEAGRIRPLSLSPTQRSQLMRFPDEGIRQRAESLFSGISSDRSAVIEQYREALSMTGNGRQGREVFRTHCSKCHQVNEMGVEVGPDLLSLTNRPKEELLANILDPNTSIVPGYEEYLLDTKDGRTITGVIAQQSATSITLRRSEGEEDTILRTNIAGLRALTLSSMPEGLEEDMSIKEMADLLEYLRSLSH